MKVSYEWVSCILCTAVGPVAICVHTVKTKKFYHSSSTVHNLSLKKTYDRFSEILHLFSKKKDDFNAKDRFGGPFLVKVCTQGDDVNMGRALTLKTFSGSYDGYM